MRFIVENNTTKAIIGGPDNLKGNLFKELRDYMAVKVDGYEHIMRQKRRFNKNFRWDGYHHFVNSSGIFPTGFLPTIVRFMREEFDADIQIEDMRRNLPIFKREPWNISTHEFDLMEHQQKLALSMNNIITLGDQDLYWPRGIWDAATNTGKTGALGVVINNMVDPRALLLIDSEYLFKQQYEFYKGMFGEVGVIGKLGKKTHLDLNYPFTMAMVETLANRVKKDLNVARWLKNNINFIAADESHTCMSGTAGNYIIHNCDAGARLFMSGTPMKTSNKITNMKFVGMSGEVLHRISKKWLMDNGHSLKAKVKVYHNNEISFKQRSYEEEFEDMVLTSEHRAKLIAKLVKERENKKILIYFFEHRHGELLYDTIVGMYPELASKTMMVHGTDPLRDEKIKGYIDNEYNILIGSTILQQGINVKDIGVLINAMAGKAIVSLSQFSGRAERLDGISEDFESIDFWDTGKYISAHSRERIKFYKAEELDIEFMYDAKPNGTPR